MVSKASVVTITFILCHTIPPASTAVAQTLPDGWSTTDIGDVGATGAASGSGTAFTVTGAGADIWGTSDAFRFVYRSLTGDGSVTARVTSVEHVAEWTKAGVMIRDSLSPTSSHAFMLVSAGNGLAFQRRVQHQDITTHTAGGPGPAPAFVRLVRRGVTVTASTSSDGASWTTVGSDTLALSDTIYVGLAVTGHAGSSLATGQFSNVDVSGLAAPLSARTLVFFRHGEKPSGGYGQLTCQGLRRALALPHVLVGRYGVPQAIVAPNPLPKIGDPAGVFAYVRPLATIEPTAIFTGLPVHADHGWADVTGVRDSLLGALGDASLVFISWEHAKLVEIVQSIMDAYGSGVTVPAWTSGDYDSLYIVRVNGSSAHFERDAEGLNNMPTTCP